MAVFPLLQPNLVLGSNILALTPELLARHQIQGMVLDVDDTIVPIGCSTAPPELMRWTAQFAETIPLYLVTNNPSQVRIGAIADSLSVPYFLSARKPARGKVRQAVETMKIDPARVAMVGDRIFTDVLVGNRLGMFTILIEPIVSADSTLGFDLLRQTEFAVSKLLGVSLTANK